MKSHHVAAITYRKKKIPQGVIITLLCLCLSITQASISAYTLQKDKITIIDPESGNMYRYQGNTDETSIDCQIELGAETGFFYDQIDDVVIHADTCRTYQRIAEPNVSTIDNKVDTIENEEIEEENAILEDTTVAETSRNNENIQLQEQSFTADPDLNELENAVKRLYTIEGTIFATVETFGANDPFTREQAAKFMTQAAKGMNHIPQGEGYECDFSDLDQANPGLQERIIQSCEAQLFRGSKGDFMPKQELTNAHILTVLTKIFQQNQTQETSDPWRDIYYEKMNALGIIDGLEISKAHINNPVSRGTAAILLYRLYNLTKENEIDNQGNQLTSILVDTNNGRQGISFDDDPEFIEAIAWMYTNNMTSRSTPNEFNPLGFVQRQHMAQFLHTFNKLYIQENTRNIPDTCFYEDLATAGSGFRNHILNACAITILDQNIENIQPKENVSKAEFVSSIIAMLDIIMPTTSPEAPEREGSFRKAVELGLIENSDRINFPNLITRYEAALILYKLHIRYSALEYIETNDGTRGNIITPFVQEQEEIEDPSVQTKITLASNNIIASTGPVGIIELEGDARYMLYYENKEEVFSTTTNRFGRIHDILNDEQIGTINLLIDTDNEKIIQGTIRMYNDTNYSIRPSRYTSAYYIMTRTDDAYQTD